jgi:hypothetical protein
METTLNLLSNRDTTPNNDVYGSWPGELFNQRVIFVQRIMKRLAINRLRIARIKSLTIGILYLLVNMIFWSLVLFGQLDLKKTNVMTTLGIPTLIIAILVFIPFNQIIESNTDSEFETYFQIGWFKIKLKRYPKEQIKQISLERDQDKFFCLTIRMTNHEDLVLERYPTLDTAEKRLMELRNTIE